MADQFAQQAYVPSFYRNLARATAAYDQAQREAAGVGATAGGPGGFQDGFPTSGVPGWALYVATFPGNVFNPRWQSGEHGWNQSCPSFFQNAASTCGGCSGALSAY